MKSRTALAATGLSLLAAAAALAQDGAPPAAPARHVNKVTEAAKAAFERMDKASYRPVAAGLKELKGTLAMKMEMPGGMDAGGMGGGRGGGGMGGMNLEFDVAFRAPKDLKVETKGDAHGPMAMMGDGMKKAATSMVKFSLGLVRPDDGEEFDADAATVDGKTVVTIINYEHDVETGRSAMTLDDRGLIETVASKGKAGAAGAGQGRGGRGRGGMGGPPGGDESSTAKFTWEKEGDRWRLAKMEATSAGGNVAIVPEYLDANGFKLATSFAMKPEGQPVSFGFRFTELAVNGKKVELPAAKAPAGGMGHGGEHGGEHGEDEDGEDEDGEEHEGR